MGLDEGFTTNGTNGRKASHGGTEDFHHEQTRKKIVTFVDRT